MAMLDGKTAFVTEGTGRIGAAICQRFAREGAEVIAADIANLVNWLASDEARYTSGQHWVIDGGLSAQVQQMKL